MENLKGINFNKAKYRNGIKPFFKNLARCLNDLVNKVQSFPC